MSENHFYTPLLALSTPPRAACTRYRLRSSPAQLRLTANGRSDGLSICCEILMRFVALLLKVLDKWWQLTTRLQIRAPHQRFKDKISLLMVSTWLSSSLPCCASLLNGIRHSKLSRVTELAREGSTVMGCRLNHIRIRRNGKCSGSARVSSVTKAGVVWEGRARTRSLPVRIYVLLCTDEVCNLCAKIKER